MGNQRNIQQQVRKMNIKINIWYLLDFQQAFIFNRMADRVQQKDSKEVDASV